MTVKNIKKRKICLLIPSLVTGGMERVMSELANYFCQKDYLEVHLLMFGRSPEIFYNVPSNLTIHKPETIFNDRFRTISTLQRLKYVRYKIKCIRPDSTLSFGEYWNSLVLLALIGLKLPIFISDRCSPVKKFNWIHTFLRRWLYPKATGIIAQTESAKQMYFSQLKCKRITVIGNPINQLNLKLTNQKENIILSVGRLIITKHHDRLIKIFSQINAPDWKLIIIGDDALKQKNFIKLKFLAQRLGLEGRVFFIGNRKDTNIYYAKSKVFVFTSSTEGFPNVIGEALSAGLPVVAYDCIAGPSELIKDCENGFLIPVFDDTLFQERLQLLINDNALRSSMREKAIESIKQFSPEIIGQKYLDFILSSILI